MRYWVAVAAVLAAATAAAQEPITSVTIGENREFRVNGEPFLPIMGWLQGPENLAKLDAVGINTITGYWWNDDEDNGAGGTTDAAEYRRLAEQAGLYFIPPYMPEHAEAMDELAASDTVLAWIHDDEPDLPSRVSDAEITPGDGLKVNNGAPLWKILDGTTHTWSVIDPLEGAELTVRLKDQVTIEKLSVWLTVSPGLAVAKDVVLLGDGEEIVSATLENRKGAQEITLDGAASFRELTLKVVSTYPGEQVWGSVGEIEGFNAAGENVLLSPPRRVIRQQPNEAMEVYETVRAHDPTRPVLMTVTCFFINDDGAFDNWCTHEQAEELYPELLKAADVPGFDVYPIYGWNRPEKLNWVDQGVRELRAYAGVGKPLYVWTETLAGGFGDKANPVTGLEMRNEVYQAIIGGATAIGYFTHRFKPTFSEFGVPEENQAAMLEINQQLARLAPVILNGEPQRKASITIAGDLDSRIMTREYEGDTYVFALNLDMDRREGEATVSLEGIEAGASVEVIDEDRTISAGEGQFTDAFAPLAVHIYRIRG